MKDWKGNKVKAGDTIVRVRVEDDHSFYPTGIFMLVMSKGPNGELLVSKEDAKTIEVPPERKYIWEVLSEHEVFLQHLTVDGKDFSYLAYVFSEDEDGHRTILPIDDPFSDKDIRSSKYIDCIKGKSDSEEDYYAEKFKA